MSKHEAIVNYLSDHVAEIVGNALGFNISKKVDANIAFLTDYADKNIKVYFSGYKRAYGFTILISKSYSVDSDDINLQAMNMAQEFNDWIDEQNKLKNYPDFGDKCDISKIESLQNMPNLSGVSEDFTVAQYMLQCKVTYYENK